MSTLSDKIFELRSQNKSYNEISKELNCSDEFINLCKLVYKNQEKSGS